MKTIEIRPIGKRARYKTVENVVNICETDNNNLAIYYEKEGDIYKLDISLKLVEYVAVKQNGYIERFYHA